MLIANCLFYAQLTEINISAYADFCKIWRECEYIDDAQSIGAISRIKRSILYFYDFIERWVCFDWKNYRYY